MTKDTDLETEHPLRLLSFDALHTRLLAEMLDHIKTLEWVAGLFVLSDDPLGKVAAKAMADKADELRREVEGR